MLGGGKRLDDLEREVRTLKRALEELQEQYSRDITVLRSQLIRVMHGGNVAEPAIREGLPFEEIDAAAAPDILAGLGDCTVLDVRTLGEWQGGHIPDALHIPLDELEGRLDELSANRHAPVVCVCAVGGRSAAACAVLAEAGFSHVINMDGGMSRWTGPTTAD